MIIGFIFVERNNAAKAIEFSIRENTQIPIFEFECLQSDSRILRSVTTG
jgi:hypothetical protein